MGHVTSRLRTAAVPRAKYYEKQLADRIGVIGDSRRRYLPLGMRRPTHCRSQLPANTAPATVAYVWGNDDQNQSASGPPQTILKYSTVSPSSSSPAGTLTLPPLFNGWPIAVDSFGQLYVGGFFYPNDNPLILVYPPNSIGAATPSRTIEINGPGEIITLAVGPNGLLYVGIVGTESIAVAVYSADATGTVAPLRTVQLPYSDSVQYLDVVADAAGNIYVAFYPVLPGTGPPGYIDVYAPDATGPTPTRTITLSSIVFGVAVNDTGQLFADTCLASIAGCSVEEFAPDADGSASPINTIDVPNRSAGMQYWGGPVRLDGVGNIFVSSGIRDPSTDVVDFFVYGFAPSATGDATPSVRITAETPRSEFDIN